MVAHSVNLLFLNERSCYALLTSLDQWRVRNRTTDTLAYLPSSYRPTFVSNHAVAHEVIPVNFSVHRSRFIFELINQVFTPIHG